MMHQKFCLFFLLSYSFSAQAGWCYRNIQQQIVPHDISAQSADMLSKNLKQHHFYVIKRNPDYMHKLVIHELTPEKYPIACAQLITKKPTYAPFVYVTIRTDAVPLATRARVAHLSYQAMQKSYQEEQFEI